MSHPWVINEIAPDFELLDVWALPVTGDASDFERFLATVAEFDPAGSGSAPSKFLFWIRLRLGELFGWDEGKARPIPGCSETSLKDRLPAELRDSAAGTALGKGMTEAAGGFVPVYKTEREFAAEISNATVHGVLHLGWVEQEPGCFRGQMGVYVKPRGRAGVVYMKAIGPFRHLIVYPALMKTIEKMWNSRAHA